MVGSSFAAFSAFLGLMMLLLTIDFDLCYGFLLFFRFVGGQLGGFGHGLLWEKIVQFWVAGKKTLDLLSFIFGTP